MEQIKHKCLVDINYFEKKPQQREIGVISQNLEKDNALMVLNAEEFIGYSGEGCTTCCANFSGDGTRKKENFKSSGFFCLDIDADDSKIKTYQNIFGIGYKTSIITLENILKRCEKYGVIPCGAYKTFSSDESNNKFRVIFQTVEDINNPKIVGYIQYALFCLFPESDIAIATDISRLFFGSKKIIHENYNAVLDVAKLTIGYKKFINETFSDNVTIIEDKLISACEVKLSKNVVDAFWSESDKDKELIIKNSLIDEDYLRFEAVEPKINVVIPQDTAEKNVATSELNEIKITDVIKALEDIPSEDRALWRKYGNAFKNDFGEGGYEAWNNWSCKASNYDGKNIRKEWDGLNPDGTYHVNSILWDAEVLKKEFKKEEKKINEKKCVNMIEEFNKRFFQLSDNTGKEVIIEESITTETNSFGLKIKYHHMKKFARQTFINIFEGKTTIIDPETNKKKSAAKTWLSHLDRRQVEKIVFEPGVKKCAGICNTWKGFQWPTLMKDQIDESKFKLFNNHIKNIIADGDEEIYKYIIGYLAHAVQKPQKLPEVSIIIQGKPGTGKSLFVELFAQIFTNAAVTLTSPEQLVGKFNSLFSDRIIVFADESFFGKNPKDVNVLKNLVTSPNIVIEKKFQNQETNRNYLRIFMASNENIVLDLPPNDRRFCILKINNKHTTVNQKTKKLKQINNNYFKAIIKEFNYKATGLIHFYNYLLNYDLKGFDIKSFPDTEIKNEHIIRSWDLTVDGFLYVILYDGVIFENQCKWGRVIKSDFLKDCQSYMKTMRKGGAYTLNSTTFGKYIKKIFGNEVKTTFGSINKKDGYGNISTIKRVQMYDFAPLDVCRERFEKFHNDIKIQWPEINNKINENENNFEMIKKKFER